MQACNVIKKRGAKIYEVLKITYFAEHHRWLLNFLKIESYPENIFTCSKSTIETSKHCVKSVLRSQLRH